MTGMAKNSTWTIGVDLGDEFSQVYVIDEEGEFVDEGRVRMAEGPLHGRFSGLAPAVVVMEVGTHSPWVSRLLEELGHECLVANPASLYRKGRNKSDRIDAEKLARWGRADRDLLEPVRHASAEVQADMAIVQSRRSLIEMRAKLVNRCRGLVKSFGERLPRCDTAYFEVKARPHIPPELAPAVEPLLETIGELNRRLEKLDDVIDALVYGKYAAATAAMM
jgi:transposase